MRRFAVVLNLVSVVTMIFAATMLLPLAVSIALRDHGELANAEAIYFTALAGALVWVLTRHGRRELHTRDGFLFVTLVWTVLPAFATLPLLIYLPGLSFTEAYFET
ncbi:MAG: TrkH family potassium uptake protein, partial [Geminicoccales bacterium]